MPSAICLPEIEDTASVQTLNRIALVVEYDGTDYFGFQWQDDRPTVQQELERAILSLTGEATRVVAASRTDTGVHALGQVVSFRTNSSLPARKFVSGLNHFLPSDVAVKSAHPMGRDFHVQKTAISRRYEYRILNSNTRSPIHERHAFVTKGQFNIMAMNQACGLLVGEHDFASFTSGSGASIERTVRNVFLAEVKVEGAFVTFSIEANSFLTHQVRNTVGALIRVGLRRMSVDEFYGIMERKQPGLAGPKAPACGLHLVRVNYPRPIEEETDEHV